MIYVRAKELHVFLETGGTITIKMSLKKENRLKKETEKLFDRSCSIWVLVRR